MEHVKDVLSLHVRHVMTDALEHTDVMDIRHGMEGYAINSFPHGKTEVKTKCLK